MKELYCAVKEAISSNNDYIHIINAQTGIGKTHTYIKCIKESSDNFIIAAPTNKLKDEIYTRLCKEGIKAMVTPELPTDIGEDNIQKLEYMYKKGDIFGYSDFLKKLANNYSSVKAYKKQLKESMTYQGNIITTHIRLISLFNEETINNHTIIIDEDIIKTLYSTDSISYKDIYYLLSRNYLSTAVKKRIKYYSKLKDTTDGIYKKHIRENPIELNITEKKSLANDMNIEFNLENFLNAKATMADKKEVHYSWIKNLPSKKIIILSATANHQVYANFFKNRQIKYYKINEVKYTGKITQWTNYSYSRKWIAENKKKFNNICKLYENCNKITFLKFSDTDNELHFGNTEGKDGYSEKDLFIFGTPFQNEIVYKLMAASMDYDIDIINDEKLNHREIEYADYKFYFFTYKDKLLRNLQIYYISSELEQSIGRARLLNKDNNVYVYSQFPAKQAAFIEDNIEFS